MTYNCLNSLSPTRIFSGLNSPCLRRFFIQENKLTTEDIDLVWDAQRDKHEAIVKNIHDLLAKLAWVLTPDLLDAIFVR